MFQTFEDLLGELKDKYTSVCYVNEKLQERLREYNKDEEIASRNDMIKRLEKNALLIMSDKETENRLKFIERHYKLHNNGKFKAIGNTYIYSLTGTGLGTLITIKCPICGEEEDITDTNSW